MSEERVSKKRESFADDVLKRVEKLEHELDELRKREQAEAVEWEGWQRGEPWPFTPAEKKLTLRPPSGEWRLTSSIDLRRKDT